ncbi:MAG: hypothetical protein R6W88_07605, partial [Desulfobacterales bacterium]
RTQFHAQLQSNLVKDTKGDIAQTRTTITNINERKLAEGVLEKAHDELGRKVKERTAELTETNKKLNREIKEHRLAHANHFEPCGIAG